MSEGLVDRVLGLLGSRGRVVLGIAGAPGAGKTTAAKWLVKRLDETVPTAWMPMDGFHLADSELERMGRRSAKGAIDTFDAYGYLAMLRRVRSDLDHVVYAPEFDRALEQPIAGGMPVPPSARIVVTEGNYLLDAADPWPSIAAELDEVWYCVADDTLRRQRLVSRHIRFGKTPDEAASWVDQVDEANAARIAATRDQADLIIDARDIPAVAVHPTTGANS